ncbi:nucleotidyltransferase family protein [Desertibaculum subflavum]|uniref:nucleotidyltransferase family protein n=1 Tax=Desertibaculum subflavum TaxID=2268458 RepID=UPI000E670E6E
MDRQLAIASLKAHAPALRAMGASALYLFGSTARGDAGPASDLDIFVEHESAAKFSLFDLAGIKLFLEAELGATVDVTTRNGLHPMLRSDIEREAVRIF